MKLKLFKYNYFDYEMNFLFEEIRKLGGIVLNNNDDAYIEVDNLTIDNAMKLTYVEEVSHNNETYITTQAQREPINGKNSVKLQSTKYGPHGLHDYKGKFNPQTPRSLLIQNFDLNKASVLDPFMGSGTTVIEARSLGLNAFGVELNPFAYEIARSKILFEELKCLPEVDFSRKPKNKIDHPHENYLRKWFADKQYDDLMIALGIINEYDEDTQTILKTILSDQIRNNSMQDPRDLRIRRLKELPTESNLLIDFEKRYAHLKTVHKRWIDLNGTQKKYAKILNTSSENLSEIIREKIDGTVSSPPYFSALPYVDTYRLSSVAFNLIDPDAINKTERALIGARDITKLEIEVIKKLGLKLPKSIQELSNHIIKKLKEDSDAGFRKQAVPFNLLRYCNSMQNVLQSIYNIEKPEAINLWVVGTNKTTLSGEIIVIDTPQIIADLAKAVGFKNIELETVDAYNRYDIHSKNSIRHEYVVKFSR